MYYDQGWKALDDSIVLLNPEWEASHTRGWLNQKAMHLEIGAIAEGL